MLLLLSLELTLLNGLQLLDGGLESDLSLLLSNLLQLGELLTLLDLDFLLVLLLLLLANLLLDLLDLDLQFDHGWCLQLML